MPGLALKQRENGIWYATGTFGSERVRESLGTRDRKEAEEKLALFQADLFKRATYGDEAVRLFEEAALSYLKHGGEGRFLAPILKYFKGRKVASIKPGEVRDMALTCYPTAKPATRNRQALIPCRAVILHAHSLGWCAPIKVENFEVPKSRKHTPVDDEWMEKFLAQADKDKLPHVAAIVLFMNRTAARVAEAVHLLGQHVDLENRVAVLVKTKTEEDSRRQLTTELALRMQGLGLAHDQPVFYYTDVKSVNKRIKAVCKRAGIPSRTSHSAGRHSYGTDAMKRGANIKDAMEGGGWKSAPLFMGTYVHADDGAKRVAELFDAQRGPVDTKLAQPAKRKGFRFGNQRKK